MTILVDYAQNTERDTEGEYHHQQQHFTLQTSNCMQQPTKVSLPFIIVKKKKVISKKKRRKTQ